MAKLFPRDVPKLLPLQFTVLPDPEAESDAPSKEFELDAEPALSSSVDALVTLRAWHNIFKI